MNRKKVLFVVIATTLVLGFSGFLLYSCGGGGGGTSSAAVGLYLTDDMSSLFTQVTATIDRVQMLNTGSGATCDVLTTPTAVDIAELANVMQLVSVTQCPAVPYNRIHVEFEKSVDLTSAPTATPPDTTSLCSFVSYKDEGSKVNTLNCSGTTCTLDINGAVNVLVNQPNKLALDFNLKDFEVASFGTPSTCSVTMKVSPLHAEEMEALGHPEGITGLISGLSTTDHTFTLTRETSTFSVLYSGITTTQQPGLDSLLQLAETDGLRVQVMSSNIDFLTNTIIASAIYVKIEGTVSNLNTTDHTFTLTYKGGKTITVDYSTADVDGVLADNVGVEVKLYGFNSVNYLASKVDVGDAELSIDN
ncbi:MAG: DUF4382 domain-containing protein [Betaproteobacteria bacterium]